MVITGWRYYNHAALPECAPHEEADTAPVKDGSVWHMEGKPLLARWTTDFDCAEETKWWYIIKDTPFEIAGVKAKRRYEINKGRKYFDVKEIVPAQYVEELYEVTIAAYEAYPKSYRPHIVQSLFAEQVKNWSYYKTYGAFHRESNELCGYALLGKNERCVEYSVHKTIPEFEKYGINAALVFQVLQDHDEFLRQEGYICDGARSIQHKTAFQDYLEKYFGFRKAYCKLHIRYRKGFGWIIKLIYPFEKFLCQLDGVEKVHKINGLLKMEKIVREQAGKR